MKKKVLILSAGEGHASLARVVQTELEKLDWEVKIRMEIDLGFNLYRLVYRFAPSLFGVPYKISQYKLSEILFKKYVNRKMLRDLKQLLIQEEPDLVVTTHYGYLMVLPKLREELKFRLINVVADPVEIHPVSFVGQADLNVGFGDEFVKRGLAMGISREKLKPIGWLVGQEFYQPMKSIERKKWLKRWGFLEDRLTLVVCGGSEGTNAILKILSFVLNEKVADRIQVVVVTGSNRGLKRTIEGIYDGLKLMGRRVPRIKVYGFTNKMAEILKMSDLVVGKAGPNLLFESVAARKPFVAVTHIEGQETGNLSLIEDYGLGWVTEKQKEFKRLLRDLINQPKLIHRYDQSIRKMAIYNEQSLEKFRDLALYLVEN